MELWIARAVVALLLVAMFYAALYPSVRGPRDL